MIKLIKKYYIISNYFYRNVRHQLVHIYSKKFLKQRIQNTFAILRTFNAFLPKVFSFE